MAKTYRKLNLMQPVENGGYVQTGLSQLKWALLLSVQDGFSKSVNSFNKGYKVEVFNCHVKVCKVGQSKLPDVEILHTDIWEILETLPIK